MDLKESRTTSEVPSSPTNTNNSTDGVATCSDGERSTINTAPSSIASMSHTSSALIDPSKTANISVRTYIYFLPYPLPKNTPVPYTPNLPDKNPLNLPTTLFEPTWTLVLTSPKSTFVDLRFLKPVSLHHDKHADELEWGFAGHSSSRPTPAPQVHHSTWTHFVDSRYPAAHPRIPLDEGDMYAISPALTLEHGHAFHPHLQAVKSHEEMWKDQVIVSTQSSGTTVCAVMRLQDDTEGFRGVVIRLGQYVQGIVVVGNEVTAERWEWMHDGGWKRSKRVGRQLIPCGVVTTMQGVVGGGTVKYGEFEWRVEEVWEW
ncbi:hypothetical protein ACEQ8H_001469 [Pleosporales sp. CAS-2024a]